MRMPGLLRPSPSLRDVESALLSELARYCDGARHVPNAWGVRLSHRDCRRRADDLPAWTSALSARLVDEHHRLGLPASGPVTVSFATAPDLQPGQYRVVAAVAAGVPTDVRRSDLLPGRPRLVLAAGGTARQGSPQAAGIDREVDLPPGAFVVGRDHHADLCLSDGAVSPRHLEIEVTSQRVLLRDLGSLNGTSVDGVPTVATELSDGNRIDLGASTLVFHRDHPHDDGGGPA